MESSLNRKCWVFKDPKPKEEKMYALDAQGEGFGSAMEFVLSAYNLRENEGPPFCFTKIYNVGHNKNIKQQEWDAGWTEFIKKYLIPSDGQKETRGNYTGPREKTIYSRSPMRPETVTKLRDYLYSNAKKQDHFPSGKKIVAVHIRRYTSEDCDDNWIRELYHTSEDYWFNLFLSLKKCFPEDSTEIHVYSEGTLDDFKKIRDFPNLIWHLSEDPKDSLIKIILSDILILSKSSFSHLALIYSKGQKYLRGRAYCSLHEHYKSLPSDGKFDEYSYSFNNEQVYSSPYF